MADDDIGLDAPAFLQLEEALPSPFLYPENQSRLSLASESSATPVGAAGYRSGATSLKSRPVSTITMGSGHT